MGSSSVDPAPAYDLSVHTFGRIRQCVGGRAIGQDCYVVSERGPYVAAAFFCEKVLAEPDGVLSFIRVIDRFTVSAQGQDPPVTMPPTEVKLYLVVCLKSGELRGTYSLTIRPEEPSGLRVTAHDFPVELNGEERGTNIVVTLETIVENQGLYWFDVLFEGNLLSRIPLRIVYHRYAAPQ
jgi:hypothetical protein